MYSCGGPAHRGASSRDVSMAEQDAAPAGEVRDPTPGRPRPSRPLALRPAAFNGWTRRGRKAAEAARIGGAASPPGPLSGSTVPGTEIAASGAPRGAFPRSQGGRTRLTSVSGGRAGRSRGLANPCVSRRSAPPHGGGRLGRRPSRGRQEHGRRRLSAAPTPGGSQRSQNS